MHFYIFIMQLYHLFVYVGYSQGQANIGYSIVPVLLLQLRIPTTVNTNDTL